MPQTDPRGARPAHGLRLGGLCVLAVLQMAVPSQAQEIGNPADGLTFAREACAECHLVEEPKDTLEARANASFFTIANTPGMTATALRIWFQTPHPNMPNLILSPDQTDNLVAYITSLRE